MRVLRDAAQRAYRYVIDRADDAQSEACLILPSGRATTLDADGWEASLQSQAGIDLNALGKLCVRFDCLPRQDVRECASRLDVLDYLDRASRVIDASECEIRSVIAFSLGADVAIQLIESGKLRPASLILVGAVVLDRVPLPATVRNLTLVYGEHDYLGIPCGDSQLHWLADPQSIGRYSAEHLGRPGVNDREIVIVPAADHLLRGDLPLTTVAGRLAELTLGGVSASSNSHGSSRSARFPADQ
jgi:hypothetical protein